MGGLGAGLKKLDWESAHPFEKNFYIEMVSLNINVRYIISELFIRTIDSLGQIRLD